MITRAEYMADSAKLHDAFYLEYATGVGFAWTDKAQIERFRVALETDERMNNIPLAWWDARGAHFQKSAAMHRVAREKGAGGVSLSDCVCMLKAAARHAVEQAKAVQQ